VWHLRITPARRVNLYDQLAVLENFDEPLAFCPRQASQRFVNCHPAFICRDSWNSFRVHLKKPETDN
jgi:hypothetical protein